MNAGRTPSGERRGWSAVAFVLPLLVLVGIGGWAVWRERATAASELQKHLAWQAAAAAGVAEPVFKQEAAAWAWAEVSVAADGRPRGGAWFDQTPQPQPESEQTRAFAAGRFGELVERHPGALSTGGLPLGPIAAFRVLQQAPDDGAALAAVRQLRELAFAFPSAITPELLEKADEELRRRNLHDEHAERWRQRWDDLERVVEAFDALPRLANAAGVRVIQVGGTPWRVEVRPEQGGWLVRLWPMTRALDAVREEWRKMPLTNRTFLALTASDHELIAPPAGSADWPHGVVPLDGGVVKVTALGDPRAAARTTAIRVAVLGGVSLTAAVLLAMAWWRQQCAMRQQRDLTRQKDDFLATVSHELRTPVASMQLLADNLASGAVGDAEAAAVYHQSLLREARGLAATTEHLLDFSLMERGQKVWRFAPLDLDRLVEEIRPALAPPAAAKGMELELETHPVTPPPQADVEGIRRIILNLADNAIKYAPADSRVSVRIAPEGADRWSIRVSDQGPGIPAHEQERVFERFFRGGEVLGRPTRGSGIGLPVARHIAECHGGTLALTGSSAAGSVFTCVLPLSPATQPP